MQAIMSDPSSPPPDHPPLPAGDVRAPQHLIVAGHELTVFVESPSLFEAMLGDMRDARHRIWVETYIFYNDDGGKRIAEALKAKARAGVDVRVLYDAVGSAMTPAAFFTDMQSAGVKAHAYHSLLEGLRRFRPLTILNRRNHRKLLIIDEQVGYFGGMNIIDNVEDLAQLKAEKKPASSGWRDIHLRLAGPQQCELAESFERSWSRAQGSQRPRRSGRWLRAGIGQIQSGDAPIPAGPGESIRFFDSGGGIAAVAEDGKNAQAQAKGRFSRAARIYTRMIGRARRQITLSMAYFVPVGGPLRALLAARKRRVGIRVIVPGASDVRIVQRAATHLYDRLLRRGFRIFERRHRMLHSKMMIIDDLYTVVGSANLDPRSLYTNLEFVAVIRSQALARIMHRICRYEISQSQRITLALIRKTSRLQRFLNALAWMVRWWL